MDSMCKVNKINKQGNYCLKYMKIVNSNTAYYDAMMEHLELGNDMDFSKRRNAIKRLEKYSCMNSKDCKCIYNG